MAGTGGPIRVLVTGEPGVGKTTLCRMLAEAGRAQLGPAEVAGVISPGVYEGGKRIAIEVQDLRTGRRRRLARPRTPGEPARSEGPACWLFDEEALAWGEQVLRAATPCRLLLVDELGLLEFEQHRGWLAGLAAMDAGDFGAAVVVVRPRLLNMARIRWPAAEVTEMRRGGAIDEVAACLDGRLFPGSQVTSR